MKKFFKEFREFAMRGNVIDLAVGVIIGSAFGKIITSVVSDIIMPPLGLLIGGVNFTDLKIILKPTEITTDGTVIQAVTLNYGNFLQNILDFMIVASCIFIVVKVINQLSNKQAEQAEPPKPSEDVVLLKEIRDLLKKKSSPK